MDPRRIPGEQASSRRSDPGSDDLGCRTSCLIYLKSPGAGLILMPWQQGSGGSVTRAPPRKRGTPPMNTPSGTFAVIDRSSTHPHPGGGVATDDTSAVLRQHLVGDEVRCRAERSSATPTATSASWSASSPDQRRLHARDQLLLEANVTVIGRSVSHGCRTTMSATRTVPRSNSPVAASIKR